uniref:hypothetical protein n=1 Tax=Serratia marcescens TaxID=615 RepID=UPI001F4C23D9|nr:hypothetical protein [Serratia marcescens]
MTLADTIKFAERHSQPAAAEKQLQLAGAHFAIYVISVSWRQQAGKTGIQYF